eukprot:TRINITY_DN4749_c0_g2_i1.p1 TRINITY_DN4749_c0_g2~~TRINITY_DN4749_c0_g2_i1.p1  ORF type:complete len:346 (-),score=20.70 TRINITY_DN4749_c0_g2_i1:56-1093(-)
MIGKAQFFRTCVVGLGGPLGTSVTVLSLLTIYCFVILDRAIDGVSHVLKRCAWAAGCCAIVSCFMCNLTDPGTPHPDCSDPGPDDESDDSLRIRARFLPDGTSWKQKWCRHCKVWRPPRCGHCKYCNRCVLRLDHHCSWMGTCVGERNLRFFTIFLTSAGAGLVLFIILGIHRLSRLQCFHVWFTCEDSSWEPLVIMGFLLCAPMPGLLSILCIGPALICAGGVYGLMILTDADPRRMTELTISRTANKFSCGDCIKLQGELCRSLLACEGPRVYCCGPIECKKPVEAGGSGRRDRSGHPPMPNGHAREDETELLVEHADEPRDLRPTLVGLVQPGSVADTALEP